MNTLNRVLDRSKRNDLLRMVEPLANYICATEQPKAALITALAVLLGEVEATHRAAVAQFRRYREN